ncbi:uracil-DNA glycosylase [Acuticoccus kandeliae]|uniref:uracil-DNA glycosylase n=1 Tax=Acuticoccus kandeliae TaxID=2073160 RepID=UPI000D3ED0C9|nr:uracil-DNA glycosylase [Acuticoccus kandeliae]
MEEAHFPRDPIRDFLRASGVTAEVEESPQNRFAELPPVPIAPHQPAALPKAHPRQPVAPQWEPPAEAAPPQASAEARAAVHAAREVARQAATLDALRAALEGFEGCPLKETARSTCFGEGPVGAAIMFVGEAPGRDEDEAGRPFVGRSGQLLEKMLTAIGLTRADVYISNVIPWRPPLNRTPSPIETATCEVFVRQEIRLVRPKVLVPLGGAAAKTLLQVDAGIVRQRGRWVRYAIDPAAPEDAIDAVATFHPAYLLRTPAEKRRVWWDLMAIRRRLEAEHGLPPVH